MSSGPQALPKVVKAFNQWRVTREKQSKIPDYLWDLALPKYTFVEHATYLILKISSKSSA